MDEQNYTYEYFEQQGFNFKVRRIHYKPFPRLVIQPLDSFCGPVGLADFDGNILLPIDPEMSNIEDFNKEGFAIATLKRKRAKGKEQLIDYQGNLIGKPYHFYVRNFFDYPPKFIQSHLFAVAYNENFHLRYISVFNRKTREFKETEFYPLYYRETVETMDTRYDLIKGDPIIPRIMSWGFIRRDNMWLYPAIDKQHRAVWLNPKGEVVKVLGDVDEVLAEYCLELRRKGAHIPFYNLFPAI